jgi:glycosyltransferase involved in cell wall biosynthesis
MLLYESIATQGIEVVDFDLTLSSFAKAFDRALAATVVHLHWIEKIFSRKSATTSFLLGVTGLGALLGARFVLRVRLVVTLHNVVPHEPKHPILERAFFRSYLRTCDAIVVHSRHTKTMAIRCYGLSDIKVHVIPCGNFIPFYPLSMSKEKAREKLGIPDEAFVFLSFGSIRRYKGPEDLLKAFDRLSKDHPNVYLIVAGDCEDPFFRNILEEYAACHSKDMKLILKPKFYPRSEVQIVMQAADVAVLTHREVTTSAVLLLYMSFSKPMVAPRLVYFQEIANAKFCTFYNGSVEGLTRVLENALSLGSESAEVRGRLAYLEALRYDWQGIAQSTVQLYRSLFADRRCSAVTQSHIYARFLGHHFGEKPRRN